MLPIRRNRDAHRQPTTATRVGSPTHDDHGNHATVSAETLQIAQFSRYADLWRALIARSPFFEPSVDTSHTLGMERFRPGF